jgi:hypothetical protein
MKPRMAGRVVVPVLTTASVARDAAVRTPHVRSWRVDVDVFEMGDHTTAHAVLLAEATGKLDVRGEAYRNPADLAAPEIGDEVAVGRALRHLADRLFEVASSDIAAVEGHPATLTR